MEFPQRRMGESAQDYAYHCLKEKILFCELEPGTTLRLPELAEQLGVSRTPIREAILRLEREQVVDIYPQSGSIVGYLNFDLASDAIFARRAMELELMPEACRRAAQEDLESLETSIELQKIYQERRLFSKMIREDNHFHRLLFSICGRERVFSSFQIGMLHLDRIRNLRVSLIQDDKVISQHAAILEAIRRRDLAAAREAVAAHLTEYPPEEKRIMMERYPQYFRAEDIQKTLAEAAV